MTSIVQNQTCCRHSRRTILIHCQTMQKRPCSCGDPRLLVPSQLRTHQPTCQSCQWAAARRLYICASCAAVEI